MTPSPLSCGTEPIAPDLLDLQSARTQNICRNVMVFLVVLGAVGRLKQYIARPSYWNDEAAVVANIISRDCRQLLGRLDYAQAAPPLFLWVERGIYKCFGANEYCLRSFPMVLSLLSLPLYAALAWKTLPPTSAAWAVGWFSWFQKILHGGPDVKQYSGDVCVAIVLLLSVFGRRASTSATVKIITLSIASAVLLWLSFPVVFLYGALSLILMGGCLRSGRKGQIAWLAGGGMVVASFIGLYRTALSHGGDPTPRRLLVQIVPRPAPPVFHSHLVRPRSVRPLRVSIRLARLLHHGTGRPGSHRPMANRPAALAGRASPHACHRVRRGRRAEIPIPRAASAWPLPGPVGDADPRAPAPKGKPSRGFHRSAVGGGSFPCHCSCWKPGS